MREALTISVYASRYDLDIGNASENVKFISVTSQSFRIITLATCLLFGGQTVTE